MSPILHPHGIVADPTRPTRRIPAQKQPARIWHKVCIDTPKPRPIPAPRSVHEAERHRRPARRAGLRPQQEGQVRLRQAQARGDGRAVAPSTGPRSRCCPSRTWPISSTAPSPAPGAPGTTAGPAPPGPTLYKIGMTTDLTEQDVVMGRGEKRLFHAIKQAIDTYQPAAVFVYNTCIPALIGDDIEAVCKEAHGALGDPGGAGGRGRLLRDQEPRQPHRRRDAWSSTSAGPGSRTRCRRASSGTDSRSTT